MELSNNAAKGPNINFPIVAHTQNDLRRSVISALNISVNGLALEATGAKVNDPDTWLIGFFQQNILRLEIGMDDFALM